MLAARRLGEHVVPEGVLVEAGPRQHDAAHLRHTRFTESAVQRREAHSVGSALCVAVVRTTLKSTCLSTASSTCRIWQYV